MKELRAIFKGEVQGVGFRATTKRYADTLHLQGYARNLANGSVELCAQGSLRDLETLIEKLKQTFSRHIAGDVAIEFCEIKEKQTGFRVL